MFCTPVVSILEKDDADLNLSNPSGHHSCSLLRLQFLSNICFVKEECKEEEVTCVHYTGKNQVSVGGFTGFGAALQ